MNSNGKVMVGLSLRQARFLARLVNRCGSMLSDGRAMSYDDQPIQWQLAAEIESAIKDGVAACARDMGLSSIAGYGLAQKWLDESILGGFGSAFRKAV